MPEKHMTLQDIIVDVHTLTEDIESCERTIQAPRDSLLTDTKLATWATDRGLPGQAISDGLPSVESVNPRNP